MTDTEKHTALILRKLKKKIPAGDFVDAKLSPDLSLIAFKSSDDKITLYSIGDNDIDGGFIKQVEIKKCEQFEWIRSSISPVILLVAQVKSGAIIIHQFFTHEDIILLNEDTTVRPVSIDDLTQAENCSEKIIELRKNSNNAILRYKIPMIVTEKILSNFLKQDGMPHTFLSTFQLLITTNSNSSRIDIIRKAYRLQ